MLSQESYIALHQAETLTDTTYQDEGPSSYIPAGAGGLSAGLQQLFHS